MPDEDTPWYIQLLVCLAVLVGVAVLIVGGLAVVGVTAARMVGGLPAGSSSTTGSATTPTSSAPATSSGGRHSQGSAKQSPRHRKRKSAPAITLTASPRQVPAYGRINLTGSYLAPDGTTLQVQRREARGWVDFPTTPSLNSGNFSTYIQTGHTGINRLRVTDPRSGKVSNVVTVKVGG